MKSSTSTPAASSASATAPWRSNLPPREGARPEAGWTGSHGRPAREASPREIVNAIRYVVDIGCTWRALPADLPPWRTVWGFMARWAAAGITGRIRDALAGRIRREMGKGSRAVATVMDSQSVEAAETVGNASRGDDAGKKINEAAWMMHARRHARDYERLAQHSEALITWAAHHADDPALDPRETSHPLDEELRLGGLTGQEKHRTWE